MLVKITTRTRHSVEIDGNDVELGCEPSSVYDILTEKVGDNLVIGYLVHDPFFSTDEDLGDGMGNLYSFHRHQPTDQRNKGLAALGRNGDGNLDEDLTPDPDAVMLDCYSHGGQVWSVSGNGMQCQFDTARGAGVWVPDDCLRDQLDADEKSGKDRREMAVKYCEQSLEQYNAIEAGEVYGVIIETSDPVNPGGWWPADENSAWGHIGYEYAKQTLAESFKAEVSKLAGGL
jgi:hypothetical protein